MDFTRAPKAKNYTITVASAGRIYAGVQIPFPSGIIKTASGGMPWRGRYALRGDRTKNRKVESRKNPEGNAAAAVTERGDNTEDGAVPRVYPAKVNRVSGTHKGIGIRNEAIKYVSSLRLKLKENDK